MNIKAPYVVIGVLAVLVVWMVMTSGTPSSQQLDGVDYSMSLTGLSGGVVDDDNPDMQIITYTNSTIDSLTDTNVSFSINLKQTDGENDANKKPIVKINAKSSSFKNVDDTTDSTDYDFVDYTTANGYDITVDGVAYKNLPANIEIDYTNTDVVNVTIQMNPGNTLDKAIENQYDRANIFSLELSNGKKIVGQYVQS